MTPLSGSIGRKPIGSSLASHKESIAPAPSPRVRALSPPSGRHRLSQPSDSGPQNDGRAERYRRGPLYRPGLLISVGTNVAPGKYTASAISNCRPSPLGQKSDCVLAKLNSGRTSRESGVDFPQTPFVRSIRCGNVDQHRRS